MIFTAEDVEVKVGYGPLLYVFRRGFREENRQAFGARVTERMQQGGVHYAEHGAVHSDSQSQREQRGEREPRRLSQHPRAVSDVLKKGVHRIRGYSYRKATIGSTVVARRAGTKVASSA